MVLLFDIDGTLLQSHGVGRRSVTAALEDVVGASYDFSDLPFSGKTDPQIFREVLEGAVDAGLEADPTAVDAFREAYVRHMEAGLPHATVEDLPGAVDLVHRLHADRVTLGLLTGNVETIAYDKIDRIGLGRDVFPFGAFGSDHHSRNELPAIGAHRASEHTGRVLEGGDVVIIGDTPRDIECARAFGAVAVAVATGHYSVDDLEDADVVLETLEAFDLGAVA
ncbi:HAD family hydrolase [Rubrivirga sp.]|uniref:HAD family hydrolase n=1 Tax=Rubrivirga sp. TaxID=1885344 RepID=UPI003C7642A9